jgi:hypothetical protein
MSAIADEFYLIETDLWETVGSKLFFDFYQNSPFSDFKNEKLFDNLLTYETYTRYMFAAVLKKFNLNHK